ncbi:hypothetical protein KGQ20_45805 [Catenulispora sp. NF23]|uniref:Uncharacterized protein n=1 Tax=Catenulispora pinistramenti TaxID=2705254 RepID=A0ABS5L718_9ACTN|nr:hypothetical protein [Catenulispora pinistramenti]MBS2540079.1 hypothetical protein [Catenulispora pinistramenti]MBS2554131.1 hypothetical protein [Catenulispora pinistramenti]
MTTKWGITALLVGGYLLALGFAGINADSGGAVAVFAVVLVLGFVVTGWSAVLPWESGKAAQPDDTPSL